MTWMACNASIRSNVGLGLLQLRLVLSRTNQQLNFVFEIISIEQHHRNQQKRLPSLLNDELKKWGKATWRAAMVKQGLDRQAGAHP